MTATPPVPTKWVGVNDKGRLYMTVSVVLVGLAFVCVVLRVWARLRQYHKLFADDYFSILSQFFAFVLMSWSIVFATSCGMGWHITQLPPAQSERFFEIFYAAELTYSLVTPSYKLAVIFLYRRIFGHIKWFSIATWVMVALSVGWGTGGIFSTIFQCTPIKKTWQPLLPYGHCIDTNAYILGNGIANLVIDALILFLPVPVIWNLQLTVSKKLALTGMFLLGAVVVVAGIVRVTTLVHVNLADPTYNLVNVAIWSEVEPALGIIGACLPTLRQFFWNKISRSYASRGYGSARPFPSSGSKTPQDVTDKSNIAVALTGWSDTDNYTEIKGSSSASRTPSSQDPEFHGAAAVSDPHSTPKYSQELQNDKSIFVTTEFSVARH